MDKAASSATKPEAEINVGQIVIYNFPRQEVVLDRTAPAIVVGVNRDLPERYTMLVELADMADAAVDKAIREFNELRVAQDAERKTALWTQDQVADKSKSLATANTASLSATHQEQLIAAQKKLDTAKAQQAEARAAQDKVYYASPIISANLHVFHDRDISRVNFDVTTTQRIPEFISGAAFGDQPGQWSWPER